MRVDLVAFGVSEAPVYCGDVLRSRRTMVGRHDTAVPQRDPSREETRRRQDFSDGRDRDLLTRRKAASLDS